MKRRADVERGLETIHLKDIEPHGAVARDFARQAEFAVDITRAEMWLGKVMYGKTEIQQLVLARNADPEIVSKALFVGIVQGFTRCAVGTEHIGEDEFVIIRRLHHSAPLHSDPQSEVVGDVNHKRIEEVERRMLQHVVALYVVGQGCPYGVVIIQPEGSVERDTVGSIGGVGIKPLVLVERAEAHHPSIADVGWVDKHGQLERQGIREYLCPDTFDYEEAKCQ